ncbi:MAG: hypothetical protein IPH28_18835 [Cytophagaceae bacterium]|nr:hypothetical protein [Cytophagaceae bacterium]MBK9936308.1 hypothetical protein [Cytophagaceae bacterium]MBL0303800.1 hypothetical protein [Cytophagaceae bacterium]MBL0326616.1 hypothetical protein [Cytophagaceae bacterium]
MSDIKDYSKLTLVELLTEQKKIKKQQLFTAILIGILIGIILYGLATRGFGWVYVGVSVFMIFIINNGSKKLKEHLGKIQSEIEKKAE